MNNTPEVRKFDAEVGKILQLMIHSLYTNKDIFLRELISNASDACDKLRYQALSNPEVLNEGEELKIEIKIDSTNSELTIFDNGVGMNKEDLINNLGTIASSGTQKFMEQLSGGDAKQSLQLIGQFGVGFYSAFMVASSVKVISTKVGENVSYIWESEGTGEYNITTSDEAHPRGTKIIMKIRPSDVEYLEHYKLLHIVKTYSDHIAFPIILIDNEGKAETVNSASALWARNKSEITNEQYKEFYHHVSHSPDSPWVTMHHQTEGNVTYTSLLFIPTNKPFDLFHPDRKARVKLYAKKVFITADEPNLIPSYLRFLRGIVDSEDLPLNISRETVQHNHLINKIKKSVVKKVLSVLKNKANEDKQDYKKFWSNFGEVIKEGLCEGALEEKEQLLDICRFYSSKSGEELIGLDEYIDKMQEGQDNIFFITGDTLENLRNNPQLEGFKARDIEVLLLPDHVDDFWVNVINQYKNKELSSINNAGIDLDKIKPLQNSENSEDQGDQKTSEAVLIYFKKVLAESVKDIKYSAKLINSPACLSIPEGGMNIRMEKYLIEQKQLGHRSSKILEVNANHPIIKQIEELLSSSGETEKTKDLVDIIFAQACLIAGESLKDPYLYITKLNSLIEKAIAA